MSGAVKDGRLLGTSGDNPYFVDMARLGPESVIYCGGLGHQIEFERALVRELGAVINCFDPTNESATYLRQKKPEGLRFSRIGLSGTDGSIYFTVKKERSKYYNSVEIREGHSAGVGEEVFEVRRVGTIMKKMSHRVIDLFKIDIEGAEYAVLDDMISCGILPNQIALEWHYSYIGAGDRVRGRDITKSYVDKLIGFGYKVIYSTRSDTEMTFARTDA
ncbi:MAG: FkbM family methyltransferase [Pikeienuella sp.]|uniref:FkbM family methyltransferase n=1 Tax=Pikeienuella sp. TaxID=2831957 RepID=UPI00391B3FD5